MAISQFLVHLLVKRTGITGEGEEYTYQQRLDFDLSEQISREAELEPKEIALVCASFISATGDSIAFVDGEIPWSNLNKEDTKKEILLWANRRRIQSE